MPDDLYARQLAHLDAIDAATPAENGCPHAIDINDEPSCTRASRTYIELARARQALGALVQRAETVATAPRSGAPSGHVDIRTTRLEANALHDAIEHAREILDRAL